MTDTFRPNDSGVDLKDMPEPTKSMLEEPEQEQQPEQHAAEQPEQPDDVDDSQDDMRAMMIAGEDRVQRRRLIMEIQRYYSNDRFGPYLLKNELVEDLRGMMIPEMQQLLADIRFCIQNKNTSSMIQTFVPQMICGLEPLVSRFYNIKGVSNLLIRDEGFKDVLEEVALESQVFTDSPPTTRLMLSIVKSCFLVNQAHAMRDAAQVKEKDIKVSREVADLIS